MIRKILGILAVYFSNLLFQYETVQRKKRYRKIKRLNIK
tara:strand:- start:2686 stop:2802 length:117 start_codon:yes stop_codon:yes gene_type:complete